MSSITGFGSHSLYTNPGIVFLFNQPIYEYDIRLAGYNLCKYYKLLPEKTLEKLSHMDKERVHIQIGIYSKKEEFREKLNTAFKDMRQLFYDSNELEINDIVAVKKDAIFTTKECKVTTFKNVEFRKKHEYTSYVHIGTLELYYKAGFTPILDVKGIDNESLQKHEDGILPILYRYFEKMETATKAETLSYLNRLCSQYKFRELPVDAYREFNPNSRYRLQNSEDTYDEYWEDEKEDLDISYNFSNVLIPLVRIAM